MTERKPLRSGEPDGKFGTRPVSAVADEGRGQKPGNGQKPSPKSPTPAQPTPPPPPPPVKK